MQLGESCGAAACDRPGSPSTARRLAEHLMQGRPGHRARAGHDAGRRFSRDGTRPSRRVLDGASFSFPDRRHRDIAPRAGWWFEPAWVKTASPRSMASVSSVRSSDYLPLSTTGRRFVDRQPSVRGAARPRRFLRLRATAYGRRSCRSRHCQPWRPRALAWSSRWGGSRASTRRPACCARCP